MFSHLLKSSKLELRSERDMEIKAEKHPTKKTAKVFETVRKKPPEMAEMQGKKRK